MPSRSFLTLHFQVNKQEKKLFHAFVLASDDDHQLPLKEWTQCIRVQDIRVSLKGTLQTKG
jgi:predicted alpha/beta hydrolase family esterase